MVLGRPPPLSVFVPVVEWAVTRNWSIRHRQGGDWVLQGSVGWGPV